MAHREGLSARVVLAETWWKGTEEAAPEEEEAAPVAAEAPGDETRTEEGDAALTGGPAPAAGE